MDYVVIAVLAFVGGGFTAYFSWESKRRSLEKQKFELDAQAQRLQKSSQAINARAQALDKKMAEMNATQAAFDEEISRLRAEDQARLESAWAEVHSAESRSTDELEAARSAFEDEISRLRAEDQARLESAWADVRKAESQLQEARSAFEDDVKRLETEELVRLESAWGEVRKAESQLQAARSEFLERTISYNELQDESRILKRDLCNLNVNVRKLQLDGEQQRQTQELLDQKIKDVGSRYLKDTVKWIGNTLNSNNFANCKQRLQDVIERCRGAGFHVPATEETALLTKLREDYAIEVRAAFEREEQARIKAQIREEQLRQQEIDRELKQLEREREAIKAALDKALADTKDQHSAEVEDLKARLAEAEAKSQRAISQAQLTKSGYVYVISNIGSFGEGVFKVGMTRRPKPEVRVKELGDASVPFPFDVHAMISCDDAPSLENALHRKLHKRRINKANPRKEFFKTEIETIFQIVKEHHGEVQYVADVEALQYRQSLSMSDEDEEYIESVFDGLAEENDNLPDES